MISFISRSLLSKISLQKVASFQKLQFSLTSLNRGALLFSDKHEWISVENGEGTVGISKYAAEALGDVVYAQLPDVGNNVAQHDECGALESVKTVSDIYTPVSGDVTSNNQQVQQTPELINKSPQDKGWLFKIKLSKEGELEELMSEEKYHEFLKTIEVD